MMGDHRSDHRIRRLLAGDLSQKDQAIFLRFCEVGVSAAQRYAALLWMASQDESKPPFEREAKQLYAALAYGEARAQYDDLLWLQHHMQLLTELRATERS